MIKYIVILALTVILVVSLVGCNSDKTIDITTEQIEPTIGDIQQTTIPQPTTSPITVKPDIPTTKPSTSSVDNIENPQQPPDDITWLSPAKVYISNFHSDARAEWLLTIHNGNEIATEKKIVITEPNETIVNIKLKYIIYGNSQGIKLESDNENDNLDVTGIIGDDSITIKGFAPDQRRIIVIEYPYYSKYNITYRLPDHPLEGYVNAPDKVQDWIIITDSTPVLAPFETREILIAVEMPAGEVINEKNWEFWISVMDVTTLGIVTTEICSRWLVTMRD